MPDLSWRNETRRLADLTDWQHNPREISEADAARLERSLAEFGQVQTIAVEPDNTIVDGHQRSHVWAAAQKFGPDYEIDVRVASRKLTDQEREGLVVALHGGASGQWDWDKLASFDFDVMQDWGFDDGLLTRWRDDTANLALMLEAEDIECVEFREYGEDIENEVEYITCPECGHKWAK